MRNQEFHKGVDGLKSLETPAVDADRITLTPAHVFEFLLQTFVKINGKFLLSYRLFEL